MYAVLKELTMLRIAALLLSILFGVLLLHPFVVHHHIETPVGGFLCFVYSAIAEREILVLPLFFVLSFLYIAFRSSITHAMRLRMQHTDIPIFLPLHRAFAQGLIHSKAY